MRLKIWLAALAAVAGLAFAGCGSSKSQPADSSGQTSLTIGYPSDNAGYADLFVSEDYGIFKKHGLDVKLDLVNSSGQLAPAVASGSVQIGVGAMPSSATAIMKGQDFKFMAMSEDRYNSQVWAPLSVRSVQQLRGKTYAVSAPNSLGDWGVTSLAEANGMKRSDINVKFVGSVPSTISTLKEGAVDATALTPPQQALLPAGRFHVISDMRTIPFPLAGYISTGSYIASHGQVIKRFLASESEALTFLRTHPQQAIASIQKHSQTTPAGAKAAYEFFLKVWTKTPQVQTALVKKAFDVAASTGGGTAPADVTKYIAAGSASSSQ